MLLAVGGRCSDTPITSLLPPCTLLKISTNFMATMRRRCVYGEAGVGQVKKRSSLTRDKSATTKHTNRHKARHVTVTRKCSHNGSGKRHRAPPPPKATVSTTSSPYVNKQCKSTTERERAKQNRRITPSANATPRQKPTRTDSGHIRRRAFCRPPQNNYRYTDSPGKKLSKNFCQPAQKSADGGNPPLPPRPTHSTPPGSSERLCCAAAIKNAISCKHCCRKATLKLHAGTTASLISHTPRTRLQIVITTEKSSNEY